MFVEPPLWFDLLCCRSETRPDPSITERTRTCLPEDHTRDKAVSLTLHEERGAKLSKIKALNEAEVPVPSTYELLYYQKYSLWPICDSSSKIKKDHHSQDLWEHIYEVLKCLMWIKLLEVSRINSKSRSKTKVCLVYSYSQVITFPQLPQREGVC